MAGDGDRDGPADMRGDDTGEHVDSTSWAMERKGNWGSVDEADVARK